MYMYIYIYICVYIYIYIHTYTYMLYRSRFLPERLDEVHVVDEGEARGTDDDADGLSALWYDAC